MSFIKHCPEAEFGDPTCMYDNEKCMHKGVAWIGTNYFCACHIIRTYQQNTSVDCANETCEAFLDPQPGDPPMEPSNKVETKEGIVTTYKCQKCSTRVEVRTSYV